MHSVPSDSRAQPVVNLEAAPYPAVGAYDTRWFPSSENASMSDVTAADGSPGVRATCVAQAYNWTIYSARGAYSEISSSVPGEVYTAVFNIRASRDLGVDVRVGYGEGSSNGLIEYTANATPTIQTFRYTFALTSSMATAGNAFLKFYKVANTWTNGDWFEVSKVMIVKGTYIGDFGAGDMPNWQWTGAANNSTSIGYPTF